MKPTFFLKLTFAVSLVGCHATNVPPARGAEYFVNAATGDDAKDGSKTAPFRTLQKAVTALKAGDQLAVAPGLYRERVKIEVKGTKEAPIVIKAQDTANPPVISGGDGLSGWKAVAGSNTDAAKHPHASELFYTDLDWTPEQLFAGTKMGQNAREPDSGYWQVTANDGQNVAAAELKSLDAASLEGARMFFVLYKTVRQQWVDVDNWNGPKGGAIALAKPLFEGVKFRGGTPPFNVGSDRFYLANHLALLDQPGEWVTQKTAAGTRLFWWPTSRQALAQAEAPRRDGVIDLSNAAYVTLRGLNICHAAYSKTGAGVLAEGTGGATGLTIENCAIYQNQRFGVRLDQTQDSSLRRCLVADNSYGVATSATKNITVEENEIAWNYNDGLIVSWNSEDTLVRRNVIHHHSRFAHPDNFQTYRGVKNITLDSNLLFAGGQGAHTQETTGLKARNNIVVGSSANLFFVGAGYNMERNTFALYPEGAMPLNGKGVHLEGNIFDNRGGTYAYGGEIEELVSRGNLFHQASGTTDLIASFGKKRIKSLVELQATGVEEGSVLADPQFASAPVSVSKLDPQKIASNTPSRLFVSSNGGAAIAVGDHIEVDFDGIDRIVKEVAADSIVIEPALAEAPVTGVVLLNWGAKVVGPIDLRTVGGKYGSTIDFEAYARADFDGNGKRDAAPWPAGIQSPRSAK